MISFPTPDPVGPGQESVWDYPRPPALRKCEKTVRIIFDDRVLVESQNSICVLETSHPPSYYIPLNDVDSDMLESAEQGGSFCEWKGMASYFDIVGADRRAPRSAWTYPKPTAAFMQIKDHLCFYAQAMDACYVGDDLVTPQPGGFYGGWITPELAGPFKGVPGSNGW